MWEWPNAKFKVIASNEKASYFDLFIEQNSVNFDGIQVSTL